MFAVKTDIAAVNGLNLVRSPVTLAELEQAADRDPQRTSCLLSVQRRLSPASAGIGTMAAVGMMVVSSSHDLGTPLIVAFIGTWP